MVDESELCVVHRMMNFLVLWVLTSLVYIKVFILDFSWCFVYSPKKQKKKYPLSIHTFSLGFLYFAGQTIFPRRMDFLKDCSAKIRVAKCNYLIS